MQPDVDGMNLALADEGDTDRLSGSFRIDKVAQSLKIPHLDPIDLGNDVPAHTHDEIADLDRLVSASNPGSLRWAPWRHLDDHDALFHRQT